MAKTNGGMARFVIIKRLDHSQFFLKAYGEMGDASLACTTPPCTKSRMTAHLSIGNQEWTVTGNWTKLGEKGWQLRPEGTFDPVIP